MSGSPSITARIIAVAVVCAVARPAGAADAPHAAADRTLQWVTRAVDAPRIEYRTFESVAAGGPVSYHIYRPAEYDDPDVRLPAVYWLHGTEGGMAGIRPLAAFFAAAARLEQHPVRILHAVGEVDDTRHSSRRVHERLAELEGLGERRGRFYRDVFAAGGEEEAAAAASGGSSATRKPSE